MSTLAKLSMGISSGDRYQIGEYYAEEGGYYAGLMDYPEGVCALFLAPKSAETTAKLSNDEPGQYLSGPSILDGRDNTYRHQLPATAFPALTHCYNYAGGGNTDWYLGSRQEMVKVFRELARAAGSNTSTTYGAVPESIPPYLNFKLQPSTASSSPNFIAGGAQALVANSYWTSTTAANVVSMSTGSYVVDNYTTTTKYVRPIRRRLLIARHLQTVIGNNMGFLSAIGTARRTWQVPDGVHSISVLLVGKGEFGDRGQNYNEGSAGGVGGRSAAASYMNNIPVVPGQRIEITTTGYTVTFGNYFSSTSGTQIGRTYAHSGGAGSYTLGGTGGSGTGPVDLILPSAPAILGNGNPGVNSTYNPNGGAGGAGGWPGGGSGGGGGAGTQMSGGTPSGGWAGTPANGAIRIIWPGDRRGFPSTDTMDEFES